ncbi:MAG: MBL fold metallo-hydrolase [Gammaproteobacteria bacterium]|nr:MAG: MBL fold metallo-hydrolase [Gammaproteobacteria bacterium]
MPHLIHTLSTLLLISLLCACSPSSEHDSTDTKNKDKTSASLTHNFPYKFEQVANNTWVIHGPRELPNAKNKGFMNNPGLVLTSAGLVVIDPGSTVYIGNDVITEIKKVSQQAIVAVFNTHIHGDHWLANQAIKMAYPDVKIYGHTEMINEVNNGEGESWLDIMDTLTEGASRGTEVVAPEYAVINADVIKVGDTHFKIHHYGIAHTKTDIMIEVVENSVVFLGDNVLSQRIPRTSNGTFIGNITSVNTLLKSDIKTYVPGHGPTGDRAMVEEYIKYLSLVYEAAKEAFNQDLDSSDVLAISKETTTAYKDWYGYDDLLGPQGAQAYSEVEEAEF